MIKVLFPVIIGLVILCGGFISIPTQAALINFSKIDKEAPSGGKKFNAKTMDENQIKVKRLDEDHLNMKH